MRAAAGVAAAALLPLFTVAQAQAQKQTPQEAPHTQRGGTYYEPPARVDPQYLPDGPEGELTAGRKVLTLKLAFEMPLDRSRSGAGTGAQGSPPRTANLQAELAWRPLPGRPWFARVRLHRYFPRADQQAWHPDFDYAFGYESWEPGTFSLVYSNFTGTRFAPDRAARESRWHFREGVWSAGYKFGLPAALESIFLTGRGDALLCSAAAHWMPLYTAAVDGALHRDKWFADAGCGYSTPAGWFMRANVFAWPERGKQQPWDPDFTYGFGWRHAWIDAGTLGIEYANDSGNRFPGRDRAPGEGRLRSGNLQLWWATDW